MKPTLESLTEQERLKLTNAARQAAMGIGLMWEALREIGKRHGCECLSCALIADELASGVGNPAEALAIPESTVLPYFLDPEDWRRANEL